MPSIVRAVVVGALLLLSAAAPAAAADFTVNTREDGPAGECTADHCSLREALTEANGRPGADFIGFDIATPAVIALTSALPAVSDVVVIEGGGLNGPGVTIDGTGVVVLPDGFVVGADGTVIRNLALVNFGGSGVVLAANDTILSGNYIGTDAELGVLDLGNAEGVRVGGSGNRILRNVISGNDRRGVQLGGAANIVSGNIIGLNAGGTVALPSGPTGAASRGDGVRVAGERNVVEDNTIAAMARGGEGGGSGVQLEGTGHTVRGNRIGTNAAGDRALGNEVGGVWVEGSGHAITENLISGNLLRGGVWLIRSQGVTVERNRIGTTADGRGALGNHEFGVGVTDASTHRIADNTIAHNEGPGVAVGFSFFGPTHASGGSGNTVSANRIFDNDGLAIDLILPYGPNTNDRGDGDSGANGLQNHPQLSTAQTTKQGTVVSGSLSSAPHASYRIELFAAPSCDGDARTYLGETGAGTDRGGTARIRARLATLPPGTAVTATATDAAGSTSELSNCVSVE